ncbi:MAG: hypothetical protein KY475_18505, partial [Planctomycetes bacterium]|nr:hypothetical protein [Planctomycetota bacterium]
MHTVEVLDEALAAARKLAYGVRQEWLDGAGGGLCEFGDRRWIFVDLSQTAAEQLEEVLAVLRRDARTESLS